MPKGVGSHGAAIRCSVAARYMEGRSAPAVLGGGMRKALWLRCSPGRAAGLDSTAETETMAPETVAPETIGTFGTKAFRGLS